MDNFLGFLAKILQRQPQASQSNQVTQIGWNDAPGGGFVPVFSNDQNPPKYKGVAPQTQTPLATSVPTPTTVQSTPFASLNAQYFPAADQQKLANVQFKESNNIPRRVHWNDGKGGWMDIPQDFTQQQWLALRKAHPSLDVGLNQINTSDAMTKYLLGKNMTYFGLLDPQKNDQIGNDLFSGKIPKTAPGWTNWTTARSMGY